MIEIRADGCLVRVAGVVGYQHENYRAQIRFPLDDVLDIVRDNPGGSYAVVYKRMFDEQFFTSTDYELDGAYLIWNVSSHVVAVRGELEVQIVYSTDQQIAETQTFHFKVARGLMESEEGQGENLSDLIEQALLAAGTVDQAIYDAQQTLDEKVTAAQTAQTAAEAAQTAAESAQHTAENAKASAVMSSNAAYNYAADANTAKRDSVNAKNDAVQAKGDAELAKTAAETAKDSANTSALKSEGYAVGTQNGTPAGSGEPYYQDNAKYYKEQAAAAKTAAEAARDTAQQTVAGIETAGTAQVQRVTAEGATQVGNVQTKGQQVLDSIPDDYSELSDNVTDLKSAIDELVEKENLLDLSQYANKSNNAITNNADGSFTFGTTDYGNVSWVTSKVVPKGIYYVMPLPSDGYEKGYSYVSTSQNHAGAIITNSTASPVSFENTEERLLYFGVRLDYKPVNSFTIRPEFILIESKYIEKDQGEDNAGKILGIDNDGIVMPIEDQSNEIGSELSELNGTLSEQLGTLGFDVLPYLKIVSGYINDKGTITPDLSANKAITFDYVKVEPGQLFSYNWRMKGSPWIAFAYYGSDKTTLISRPSESAGTQDGDYYYGGGKRTVPNNAYYLRLTMRTYGDYTASLMMEKNIIDIANDKYLPNLFCIKDASLGYLSWTSSEGVTISPQTANFEMTSDFIEVPEFGTITAKIVSTILSTQQQVISCYEFDNNKGYLRRSEKRSENGDSSLIYTFTVGANTKYVRIMARFHTDGKLMIVMGEKEKEWIPNEYDLVTEQKIKNGERDAVFMKGMFNPLIRTASPKVVMHRGASNLAPENTVPAFELAGQTKAFAIETDVYETTDGYFVLMHDNNVAGMTDGTGNLTEMTYAQTQELTIDAGANIQQYPNLKIPILSDFLKICRRYGKVAFVEIKTITHYDDLIDLIRLAGMEGSTVLLMYNTNYYSVTHIAEIRNTTYMPILLISNTAQKFESNVEFAKRFSDIWICANKSVITSETLALAHMANVPVNAYTYSSKAEIISHVEIGLDMATSNDFFDINET